MLFRSRGAVSVLVILVLMAAGAAHAQDGIGIAVSLVSTERPETGADEGAPAFPDLVIGETATYDVTYSLPDGNDYSNFTARETWALPGGTLPFIRAEVISVGADITNSNLSNGAEMTSTTGSVALEFGTLGKASDVTFNADDTIVVRYEAYVLFNAGTGNGSTVTTRSFVTTGGLPAASEDGITFDIVEPSVGLTANISPDIADAADTLTVSVTIAPNETSTAPAQQLFLNSVFPGALALVAGTVNVSDTDNFQVILGNEVDDTSVQVSGGLLDPDAAPVLVTYEVLIEESVSAGSLLGTTPVLTYRSIPSPSGQKGVTYGASATDSVQVPAPTVTQRITSTPAVHAYTVNAAVIGEVLTFEQTVTLPEGEYLNASWTESLGTGLGLLSLTALTGSDGVAPDTGTLDDDLNASLITNSGRSIVLNIGKLMNANTNNETTDTLTLTYDAVVLDVPENADGVFLRPATTFGWGVARTVSDDGSVGRTVRESSPSLVKTAAGLLVNAGGTQDFSLDLNLASDAAARAHDLSLADTLPGGLTVTPGSVANTGLNGNANNPDAQTITAAWENLLRSGASTITYTATADDLEAETTLTNTATLTWSSLPGDVTASISSFNPNARERLYTLDTTATITVNGPPVAEDDTALTRLDTALFVPVLANDTDPDGNLAATSILIDTDPAHGTAAPQGNGTIRYTPTPGFTGEDAFTYTVADDLDLTSNVATVTVTVNDPPVAADDDAITVAGQTVTIDVLANDMDSDGTLDRGSVSVVDPPAFGSVSVDTNTGAIRFIAISTALPTSNTQATFGYTVTDDSGDVSNTATVTVTVLSQSTANDCPGLLPDGDFEAPASGTPWIITGDNAANILDNASTPGAWTGDQRLRFGGDPTIRSQQAEQTFRVPESGGAALAVFISITPAKGDTADRLRLYVDGSARAVVEDDDETYQNGYRRIVADVSDIADGGFHTLRIDYSSASAAKSSIFDVDAACLVLSAQVPDVDPPVVTLNGDNPIVLGCDEPFSDPGATAYDGVDGPVLAASNGNLAVNTTAANIYTVTYTAVDEAGNVGTARRSVIVKLTDCAEGEGEGVPEGEAEGPGLFPTDVYVSGTLGDNDAGDGSVDDPWRTIGYAMDQVGDYASLRRPVTINVGDGTYPEQIRFADHVRIAGQQEDDPEAVVILPPAQDLMALPVAVDAARNTVLKNVTVRLPANAPAGVTLVRMLDVSMRLVNITLDGSFRPESVALQALGRESSAALVRNSTIMQAADGLRAVNTTLVFFLNTFTDIQNDAVVVYELDLKGLNVAMNTPQLGDANRLATTGSNTFRNVGGFFIRNLNPNTTFAQNNDWGLETAQEVEAKMEGDVEFEPFLGQTNFFGSTVTVTLLDAATMLPVTGADLETIPFVGNAEESGEAGVYVFPLVPTGNYTLRAEADAYVPLTDALMVDDAIETADFDLLPLNNPAVQSADQDADGRLNLFELIRVIQFLNSGALHCDDATEDGFAPGPGDTVSCDPHALDYNPQDWEVNLTEILRSIQFFNLGGYTYCPEMGTEDGFCPGP